MHDYLVNLLCCPSCNGDLNWNVHKRLGDHIEEGEAACPHCSVTHPIRDGIGFFLTREHQQDDLWEDVESNLMNAVHTNPDLGRRLMDVPLESLEPADQFFRAMVLEERGDFEAADAAEEIATEGLYTDEYIRDWTDQTEYLLGQLVDSTGPVVDIASGRCYLVKKMAQMISAPIVASDFSPQVMRRNRRWLEAVGLYERVSLLVFDARQTPFKDRSVEVLTTNLGLPNIREGGDLFSELKRIVSGRFLSITHFYPEDGPNADVIASYGLDSMLFRDRLVGGLLESGFQVDLANIGHGKAIPTPTGVVVEGAKIDALPVADVELEWCVIEAS